MKIVIVVCNNPLYYKEFCLELLDLLGNECLKMFNHKLQTPEANLIPVYVEDKMSYEKIRGLRIEKVILFNCSPDGYLMDLLRSSFRDKRPDFMMIRN